MPQGDHRAARRQNAADSFVRRVVVRAHAEQGFSLVELLIAVTVLSFGLLALASVSMAGMLSLRDSGLRQQATEAAAEVLDAARDTGYRDLANLTGDANVTGSTYDPDGAAGCLPAESIVRAAAGPITGAPYQQGPATPDVAELSVRTYVTQVAALDCATPPTAPPTDARRVTVVVSWRSGSTIHDTRKSTLVALSGWGRGDLRFEIAPRSVSVSDVPGRLCASHLLTNQGERDSYTVTPPPTLPPTIAFTAFQDLNTNGEGEAGEQITISTDVVEVGGTLPLLFCYDVAAVNVTQSFDVTVRSTGNSALAITLDNDIATIDELRLYLHAAPAAPNERYGAWPLLDPLELPMDRVAPTGALGNWDTDNPAEALVPIDGMGLPRKLDPGALLPLDDDVNDYQNQPGVWDYQFPRALTLNGDVTINAWFAPTSALLVPDGSPLFPYVPMAIRYRLLHTTANGAQIGSPLAESPADLSLSFEVRIVEQGGWLNVQWTPNFAGPLTVDKHERLKLRLVCDYLESADTCNAAFDAGAYQSFVEVGLQ